MGAKFFDVIRYNIPIYFLSNKKIVYFTDLIFIEYNVVHIYANTKNYLYALLPSHTYCDTRIIVTLA